MKYCYLFLLLVFTSTGIIAQDSLETRPFRDHFTLDLNGSIMLFPFVNYYIPYNVSVSPGIKLSRHLAATVSYSNFGIEAEYYSKNFAGYGVGIRYDRFPFLLKAELIHMTRYNHTSEWNSWNLRDKTTLNPMVRVHVGFRVAPRFTLGFAIAHFRDVKVSGYGYESSLGDWTAIRKNINDSSLQLFFGLSVGRQTKSSN